MKLVEHYIMRGTRRLVLIIVGFLIFIFASYSAQRYLTEAANGTLALDVVLDIVFYKVLIALEMLLPVGLYASVGVTLGQMYTDSEITAISAAGQSGTFVQSRPYLAIPLSIFVTLLSMYGRPRAYAQIYQLEQQSQSELDVRQLRAKKFNTNDNGRMILSQTVDQDNNRLTDALIYTSTANRTRIFRARSVDGLTHHPRNRPLCCITVPPIFSIIRVVTTTNRSTVICNCISIRWIKVPTSNAKQNRSRSWHAPSFQPIMPNCNGDKAVA